MPKQITPKTTLENLKKEAKSWLKALRANDAEAYDRYRRAYPNAPEPPALRHVQHALALEYGATGWGALKTQLADEPPIRRYERVADAVVSAYRTGEENAMHIVWDYFGHMRAWDGMKSYMRLDLGKRETPQGPDDDDLTHDEARYLVARGQGFETWEELTKFVARIPPGKILAVKSVSAFTLDGTGSKQVIARSRDWDEIIDIMRERQVPGLDVEGQMTDDLLERFSRLDHLTTLELNATHALTDDGLRYLARLPRLRRLNLGACSAITDRGLEVLRHLPALESITLQWTSVTDAGAAHLAACGNLRAVDLMGTRTGDGAIRALTGKSKLHDFRSGNAVTDAGLALLHEFPVFKRWQGEEPEMGLLRFDARPNFLILRGPFTNEGFEQLVGLDGLFALNLDSNQLRITGAALAPLVDLPHLEWLGFDAKDESMPYIAALPRLRFLMCQDTVAGDDGFVALSRSRSIENIWGRRCYNLQRRGFLALSTMPALRSLSVSCKNVDDLGLSAFPSFPTLRELMPMDVPDDGYRHIGKCRKMEALTLMYCRETTDAATEHLTGLTGLKKYFASYNLITDRTPEILSGISSLEEVTFDSCAGLSNAGIAALARLPRLRQLSVGGMPMVTKDVAAHFASHVSVRHVG
jgi:hypothetical protein